MKHVYLAPCDSPDFDESVRADVELDGSSEIPEPLAGEGTVRFWGAASGSRNESNFERLEAGDLVLFYSDGEYVSTAWVESTFEDEAEWASSTVWTDKESSLLYTLTDVEEISVPREKVNTIFGYTGSYSPAGLMRVNPDNVDVQPASIKLALQRIS